MKHVRIIALLLIVGGLLLLAVPALAQDVPTDPNMPLPIIPVEQAGELLVAALIAIVVALIDSPITALGVALLKHIPFLNPVPAKTLQFVVAGLITVIYWISAALGYGAEFNSVAAFLLSIAPAILGQVFRQGAASYIYKASQKNGVGFVGYQRPTTPEEKIVASMHDVRG